MSKKYTTLAVLATTLSVGLNAADLPADLQWIDNMNEPLFASEEAQFGGTLRSYMSSFPQTLRSVGPDSNSGLRHYFMDGTPKLAARHPNTNKWIPQLAEAWAYGDDNQTVYFKLNPKAKWSDGEMVTADDYVFMLTYNRSKDIIAPWYNDFFTNKIADVVKIDDYTIAIKSASKMSQDELMIQINLPSNGVQPRPEHFFADAKNDKNGDGIDDNFVRKFNFKLSQRLGPITCLTLRKVKASRSNMSVRTGGGMRIDITRIATMLRRCGLPLFVMQILPESVLKRVTWMRLA